MVHRNSRGFFGDIAVFPGGKVEDIDVPAGLSSEDEVSSRNAAVRELAEETGIVLTDAGEIASPGVRDGAFYDWLETAPFSSGAERLVLVSRWVTPEAAPRRFDTRFYVVVCADPPDVVIDTDELVGHDWIEPTEALERHRQGSWAMIHPTLTHLRWLRRWSTADKAIRSARGADGRTLIVPRIVDDGSRIPIHMPAELP